MSQIFFVLAAVCFGLGAARVAAPVNWTDAGFCFTVIGLWLV